MLLVLAPPGVAAAAPGSDPAGLVRVGDTIFFRANDGSHGNELWKSDGTPGGTALVEDVNPDDPGACPCGLVPVGSQVFFSASDGDHGYELWKSNGTAAGTAMVEDITPGPGTTGLHFLAAVGSELFFAVENGPGQALTLWKSDGTAPGTTEVAPIGIHVFDVAAAMGSSLYFLSDDGVHGFELWTSDGTPSGTEMVFDLNPGPGDGVVGDVHPLHVWGSRLFFAGDDGDRGTELWRSNGTEAGTHLVKNINPGADSSFPTGLTSFGDLILFAANDGTTNGQEVWKTDGTGAGTKLVKDITPGGHRRSRPYAITPIGSRAVFTAFDGGALYRTDGTTKGTHIVRRPRNGGPTGIGRHLERVEGIGVLFEAAVSSLWRSNGWRNSTLEVLDIDPSDITALRTQQALFAGDDGAHGKELWTTDGTPSGTQLLVDINP